MSQREVTSLHFSRNNYAEFEVSLCKEWEISTILMGSGMHLTMKC